MVPFSIEKGSEGRNCLFHFAAVLSLVSSLTGSGLGLSGILLSFMYFMKFWPIMMSRNFLLKGPA